MRLANRFGIFRKRCFSCAAASTSSKEIRGLAWSQSPRPRRTGLLWSAQATLPRLPLPKLEDTLNGYLSAAVSLFDGEEDKKKAIQDAVDADLRPDSALRRAHAKLARDEAAALATASSGTSFVSQEWNDMYLNGRWGLAANSNPGVVFREDVWNRGRIAGGILQGQCARAAQLVAATASFARDVEMETLAPDSFRGLPCDSLQYESMFCATRIPVENARDELKKADATRIHHIAVIRGSSIWKVGVVDESNGELLSPDEIERKLEKVCRLHDALASPPELEQGMCALTAMGRDAWGRARAEIEASSAMNSDSLRAIDNAIFVLCLDTESCRGDFRGAMRSALFGNPKHVSSRWFDKSITISVSADGICTANFEHSWGDGACVMRCLNDVWDRIVDQTSANDIGFQAPKPKLIGSSSSKRRIDGVERIEFHDFPETVKAAALRAGAEFEMLAEGLVVDRYVHNTWGTEKLKEWSVSPDAIAQIAMQLAYFMVRSRDGRSGSKPDACSTYESCSMVHFLAGRTETVRPATAEARAFVVGAAHDKLPPLRLNKLLRAASDRHRQVVRNVLEGQGFDRHLFALRQTAEETSLDSVHIFDDPAWDAHFSNVLSTSTVSSALSDQAIFGPVHPDGFGVAYHLEPNHLSFGVTAYKPNSAQQFAANLKSALRLIEIVLNVKC